MTKISSDPNPSASAGSQDNPVLDGPSASLQELGRQLTAAREDRGLSREALASQLNMGLEQLVALETGNRSRLPETVFIVAQARRVASHLQANIDAPIQALRRALPPQGATVAAQAIKPAASTVVGKAPSVEAAAKPAGRSEPPSRQALSSNTSTAAATSQTGSGSPLPSLLRGLAWLALLAGLGSLAGLGWSRWQDAQRQPRLSPDSQAAPPPLAPTPAAKPIASPAATPATKPDELVLTAPNGASWLNVQTVDGEQLYRGDFEGRRSFPIGRGLRVLAGRPDLVQVQAPGAAAEPMGTIEDVRERTYEPATP